MAPRQLLLELEEVDMAADKGPKRVRVDRADESSTQHKTPSGVAAPPITITAKAVHYKPFRGLSNFSPILNSFMVSSSFDPFLPTAAELAGDAPSDEPQNKQPSERQACHRLARRALPAHQNNTKAPLPPKLEPVSPRRRRQQGTRVRVRKSVESTGEERASVGHDARRTGGDRERGRHKGVASSEDVKVKVTGRVMRSAEVVSSGNNCPVDDMLVVQCKWGSVGAPPSPLPSVKDHETAVVDNALAAHETLGPEDAQDVSAPPQDTFPKGLVGRGVRVRACSARAILIVRVLFSYPNLGHRRAPDQVPSAKCQVVRRTLAPQRHRIALPPDI
eukprot:scaffold11822_cov120-Isochrysis_galbana.AAC.5